MNSIRPLVLILFVTAFAGTVQAQMPELIKNEAFRADAKVAVDSVYNFQFEGAEKELSEWKKKYPKHPLWSLFEGMQLWWTVLSDLSDDSRDEIFFETMQKTDYRAGKLLHRQSDHVDALLIRAISNGYMARQYANREEWITSLNYGRKALQAYNYLLEVYPQLNDLKLAEGLKQYYLDYIPDRYPVVRTVSWALPEGDKSEGLKLIRQAAKEAIFARAEAIYFLGNINYNYEEDFDSAVQNFETLYQQFPRNNYYVRILVKAYYRQSQFEKAHKVIDESLERWQKYDLPHHDILREELWTWKGRILDQQEKERASLQYFKKAVKISEQLGEPEQRPFYIVSAYFAGKVLYYEGDKREAESYLKKAVRSEVKNSYREKAQRLLDIIRR